MSLLKFKFLPQLPDVTASLVDAALATGDYFTAAFGKIQGQINALKARERVSSKTITTTTSDYTFTYSTELSRTFASAPRVILQAQNTSTSEPTLAELVGAPTATSCVIRTYRTKTTGVLLGGTVDPVERIGATVHVLVSQ